MTTQLLLTLLAVFGTVAIVTGSIAWTMLSRSTPGHRRLQPVQSGGGSGVIKTLALTPEPNQFANRMATFVPRSPKGMSSLRRRFVRAGIHTTTPIAIFTLAQIVLPLILGLTPLIFGTFHSLWAVMFILALIGLQIPSVVLSRKIAARQKAITNGLPDALDLFIVCLEAGSSLDQAILKASEELALSHPAVAEELKMLITETRAGKPRLEAFRNFASRTGVDDVRALVSMLVQTDRFGTSVSQALRTHAEVARTKRRQRAEERAAKIGVKLVFPLVFLLFPAFYVVTLGPAVVLFIRVFFGQVMGQ
jgi:tight adherence protein C